MTLNRKMYDFAWATAVVIGALAVIAADSSYGFAKPYLYGLLGAALLIASGLAFFVKREDRPIDISSTCATENATSTHSLSGEAPTVAVADVTAPHAVQVQWSIERESSILQPGEISVGKTDDQILYGRKLIVYLEEHLSQHYIATLGKTYQMQPKSSRRRNILSEAFDLAKKLQGTGSEVLVSPDDYIVIRDSHGAPMPGRIEATREFTHEDRSTFVN